MFINANPQGILYHDADNYTLYVSPYMVVNKGRFTKHYYAEKLSGWRGTNKRVTYLHPDLGNVVSDEIGSLHLLNRQYIKQKLKRDIWLGTPAHSA